MDDSDETICDDAEDPSQSQMSPSIITPIPRLDDVHQKTFTESESTITGHGSPEYLPPSAKMQRLADKEKRSLTEGCTESRVCHELKSSQATCTASMEKTAAEKLTLIREQEEKIEELMVLLESNVKRGVAPRESPIFVQVKHLMTTVKTQLADFTRYQQQQRQVIASHGNRAQRSEDSSSSQWTSETKHKLLELANQQKQLLKLFQHHKTLLEKIQALKQKAKSVTKHIIPTVELHSNTNRGVNGQREITGQSTQPSLPMTLTASKMNPASGVTKVAKTIPHSGSKQVDEQFVNMHTLMNVPPSYTQNRHRPFPSPPTVASAVSQVTTQVDNAALISHTPATMSHHISSVTQTSVTPSAIPQPRVQNVVLTGGQLYHVGDTQVYVLPQGLFPSDTSSLAVAQATQPHQITAAKLLSNKTSTTSVTNNTTVTQEMSLIPSSSMTISTQVPTLNTIITLPSTASSWQDQITHTTPRLSISNTPVTSSCLTLPISATVSLCNSSLPVSTARSVSNSSALQHMPLPTGSETANHRSKQTTDANHSDLISRTTSENTATVTHLPKSTRIQPQHSTPSQNTAGVQSSLQAAKMTAAAAASKGPAVQSKSGQSLQRRNSFGSDLPDLKTLLGHNIIEAGSNVLSMQFEGRSFEASLRPNGLIESAGGETFRTPMAWMRAVTGSWNTVKQSHAYKMVHYKGRPLALFTIPSTENDSCENRGKQNVTTALNTAQDASGSNKQPCNCGHLQTNKEHGLLTCWEDVAKLLTDCKVIPISKDELVPTESFLPANFWDSTSEVDIPQSLLEDLDF